MQGKGYFSGTLEEWVALHPEKKEIVIRSEPIFAVGWPQSRKMRYALLRGRQVAVEWDGQSTSIVIEV